MTIQSIEARLAEATEGPWATDDTLGFHSPRIYPTLRMDNGETVTDYIDCICTMQLPNQSNWQADRDFIAHSRQDIPALLEVAKAVDNYKDAYGSNYAEDPACHEAAARMFLALAKLEAME